LLLVLTRLICDLIFATCITPNVESFDDPFGNQAGA